MKGHDRKRLPVLFAACCFAIASCSTGVDKYVEPTAAAKGHADPAWPVAAIGSPSAAGFSAEGLAALDRRLTKSVADQDVAGIVYILGKGGKIVAFNAHGVQSGDSKTGPSMAKDSIFRLQSMTKPVTGVAMMQLYEKGLWHLDDPVTKYAPQLAGLKVLIWQDGKPMMRDGKPVLADPKRPPTMRELMSHTAGLGYGRSGDDPVNKAFNDLNVYGAKDLNEMMDRIGQIPLLYEPGSRWYYSSAADIQGYIVEKLSGQKFGDYLKANVLTPLGMSDTSFVMTDTKSPRFTEVYRWDETTKSLKITAADDRPGRAPYSDPTRLEYGGGGLVSTAHDYARLCQMLLNKGELGGKVILKPETVALMSQNQIGDLGVLANRANPNGQKGLKFGLDFAVITDPAAAGTKRGAGTFYWTGATGTWFWVDPVNDLFFVGLIQQRGGSRPGSMEFQSESADLVYAALTPAH